MHQIEHIYILFLLMFYSILPFICIFGEQNDSRKKKMKEKKDRLDTKKEWRKQQNIQI